MSRPSPAVDLGPLLAPSSIAIVGATDRPGSYGGTALNNLLRAGYGGRLVGVHPTRTDVHGIACVPRLDDLDDAVDAVVVATPADTVPSIIDTAGQIGCGGAVVFAAEFAETGRQDRQDALVAAANRHALPVIGPNGNGLVAMHHRAPLWGDVVEVGAPGGVAMITQSGNIGVDRDGQPSRAALAHRDQRRQQRGGRRRPRAWTSWPPRLACVQSRSTWRTDGNGSAWAEALAKCARERRTRRGAQGRPQHCRGESSEVHTPQPSPVTTASSSPWSRRPVAPGAMTPTSCWTPPSCSPAAPVTRRRTGCRHLLGRRLRDHGGRSGPTRRHDRHPVPGDARRAATAAP